MKKINPKIKKDYATNEKLEDMKLITNQELMDMFNSDLCFDCQAYLINDNCPEGCEK